MFKYVYICVDRYVHGTPISLADIFLMFGYSSPEETVMIPSTYTRYMVKSLFQSTKHHLMINFSGYIMFLAFVIADKWKRRSQLKH